ncbi:hypothetical protein LTR35_005116 [Friedmanniomyces endolithicus]|uniref:Uncharacterized protein n=1 Tax=Friedmanniomyces endolithicus TaxID=329885 RepID=A0AAN6FM24_9PEZI|nr:hypothetical protein LTR35_005116 [Friedmanniomyces endolithicus]KAK0319118.1 hypothetical protein LTR82_009882 [Friedmanniomyces endolithicus]KAK0985375.1 hypothetical protein LTR54_013770 [Friedmanniomyces endolithicus]KAK1049571.1 hypothetical protein LTR74_017267 [Friedmanniomyces endolithicus]
MEPKKDPPKRSTRREIAALTEPGILAYITQERIIDGKTVRRNYYDVSSVTDPPREGQRMAQLYQPEQYKTEPAELPPMPYEENRSARYQPLEEVVEATPVANKEIDISWFGMTPLGRVRRPDTSHPSGCRCARGKDGLPLGVAKPSHPPELPISCGTCGPKTNCVDPVRHELGRVDGGMEDDQHLQDRDRDAGNPS